MISSLNNVEFFQIINKIDDNNHKIEIKNKNISDIKRAHGIQDDDIHNAQDYDLNSQLLEEE